MTAAHELEDGIRENIERALARVRDYLFRTQKPDGTWASNIQSDPRPTAFYLNTLWCLGRSPSAETREMEDYLASEQLECGGWQAWPGGEADIDVTTICQFALRKAETAEGRYASRLARRWLIRQPPPRADSFWKGYLAVNGYVPWTAVPYLTPRIASLPAWLHPNIYDFSFLRIAVVATGLLQAHPANDLAVPSPSSPTDECEVDRAFNYWLEQWLDDVRRPIRGGFALLCSIIRVADRVLPIGKAQSAALRWLLLHQEADGSFFSSVHMTSIAVVALHRADPVTYQGQVEAGLSAMRNWQVSSERGRRQQFTDSTGWDTILALDLLLRLGVNASNPHVQRARANIFAKQSTMLGDWSHRVKDPAPGGWAFQECGRWYPDVDDTVMAICALLELGDSASREVATRGLNWLFSMQSSDGSWASWDRNDRGWMTFPSAGPWFAHDLGSSEITARAIILLSRILRGDYVGLNDVVPTATKATSKGFRWLRRQFDEGKWYGRWFTHYLYGTCHALEAYRELGINGDHPSIQASLRWLLSVANADGGFGEAPLSGRDRVFITAASTPFHTACGLIGLIHAGAWDHPAARRAAAWLIGNQNSDGRWINQDFFAAGLPGVWYANFEFTATYFCTKSLLLFSQHMGAYRSIAARNSAASPTMWK